MSKSFYYDVNENKWKSVRGHDCTGAVWVDDATEEEIRAHLTKIPELAEARAEIERLRELHLDRASATLWAIMRHAFMDGAFKGYQHGTEERLRVQYFNEWCQKNYPEAVGEAIAQMGLIEQMREALRLALSEARSTHCEQTILAALSAAERGE